ncbi:hypothetical protein L9F63_010841, partial [Diploptera punctata]
MMLLNDWRLLFLHLCFLLTKTCVAAYKPVFLIHGILSENTTMIPLARRIQELHPGTKVYITAKYSDWSSLLPMWHQVQQIGDDLMRVCAEHPEGIHLLGYSQGGLVARAILEQFPNHTVHNFISLSSPQAGQYGTEFLHVYFPGIVRRTAYELFYSLAGQHISVGNYWNDPHHQNLYQEYSVFLPYINNVISSPNSNSYKSGFTKLQKLVLIGGPDDGVITPWQSSHFAYYDKNETVVEMRQRTIYTEDTFGLKTLDKKKRLIFIEQNGVNHTSWHSNLTVIDKCN